MLLRSILSLFKKKKEHELKSQNLSKRNQITFWTAGINFEGRKKNVLKCSILETVSLVREPDNEHDHNAIQVKRRTGQSLGWVGKNLARELAPLIDKGLIPDYATVIELKCNLYEDVYGIKIAISIQDKIYHTLSIKQKEVEFLIDVSEHGNIYLLLDCDESTLDEICHLLGENDVDVLQSGISYRPGSNGKLYSWYLRLNRETNQQKLETLFRIHYPILEEKYDQELTAEYVELQEAELHHLKKENERLITSVKHLERIRDRSEQMNSSLQNQVREMLHLSLPNVEFIFDSVDILLNEIKDYASPIHHLVKLRFDNNYKGKKILLLDKWWELHFSTGQKDDGRLYFKRHGEKLLVLISFKKSQKRDIDRLKEFNA